MPPANNARAMPENLSPICVYCGASSGNNPLYARAARALGDTLARRKIDLVYGGGRAGLMGHVADAVLAGGGHVLGVITRQLVDMETAHTGVSDLRIVRTMHERKASMAEAAGAFVALPGGVGTLDELFEVLAWAQLRIHHKPIGVLNVGGFFDGLLGFLDRLAAEGFLRLDPRAAVTSDADPDRLLDRMAQRVVPRGAPG
jgi:hypothetical protein